MKKLLDIVEEEFDKRLGRKTNWGRNELKLEFATCLKDALIRYHEEKVQCSENNPSKI